MITRRIGCFFLFLFGLGFIGSIFWSFWVDTLRPFLRQENYTGAIVETGGFLLALVAIGLMGYSAHLFLRNIRALWANPDFQQRVYIVQHKKEFTPEVVNRARWENLVSLWHAGLPALPWMGLGWGLLFIAGLLLQTAERSLTNW